jgi:hypothetical protein
LQRQRDDRHVHASGSQLFEKERRDFLYYSYLRLWAFSRERGKHRGQKIWRNRWNHAHADRSANRCFALDDVASRRFKLAKHGSGAREKSSTKFRQANGAAQTIEEPRSQFVFELSDLLGERRLGDVRVLGGAAEAARLCDSTEVT